jgi:integrase
MPDKRVVVWVQQFQDRPNLVLQWTDPETGKRKSQSAGTADPKEAEQRRADLEADLNDGRYAEASLLTWERFRELDEAEYVATKLKNTRENYTAAFDAFERLCKPGKLRSVNERMLSTFASEMRKEKRAGRDGLAPSTIRVRLQLLHAALRWAWRQKLIPAVPVFPSVKVPKKKPQAVPAESFERLVAKATDPQLRAFLLCGWLGGLRLAEAFHLEWEPTTEAPYLDLAGNRIVFPAEFVKAVEDQWTPLDPVLREALEALPRHGRKVFHFTHRYTGNPVLEGAIGERIVRLARKAGVLLTMKSLRRGYGCRNASRVPAQVLQKLMRHSNITVTMAYYANVDQAAMDAVLGPSRNDSRNREASAEGRAENGTPQPIQGQDV